MIWMKRILTGLLTLMWLLAIGSFSAQQGQESGSLSRKVSGYILALEEAVFQKEYTPLEKENKIEAMQLPVRKLAHMSEYGLLVILTFIHLSCYSLSFQKRLLTAWLFALCYAALDEIHQLFVPGRSGQLLDVCIDGAGALLAVGFLWICGSIIRKKKRV